MDGIFIFILFRNFRLKVFITELFISFFYEIKKVVLLGRNKRYQEFNKEVKYEN